MTLEEFKSRIENEINEIVENHYFFIVEWRFTKLKSYARERDRIPICLLKRALCKGEVNLIEISENDEITDRLRVEFYTDGKLSNRLIYDDETTSADNLVDIILKELNS